MKKFDIVYPLLAALCYGTNPVLVKKGLQISNEPILGASIGAVIGSISYLLYFCATEQTRDLLTIKWRSFLLFSLAGISQAFAIFSFYLALKSQTAAVVAPLTATAPLITLLLSHFLLREAERVTWRDGVGTIFIVLGVVLIIG
ncbi:MAG: EamA family transporter [Candidatus Tectomicrobia bacterium]|nr:EamA family transporter [Candidatus Tectomicrobia bacterium]